MMTWTTGIGIAYGFCEVAAYTAPPELQWIFSAAAKALLVSGFIKAADHRGAGYLPPQDPPKE